MNQYNIYDLDWTYLGKFWGVRYDIKNVGDYIQCIYNGCIETVEGETFDAILPIKCYIKNIGEI